MIFLIKYNLKYSKGHAYRSLTTKITSLEPQSFQYFQKKKLYCIANNHLLNKNLISNV